jgi:YVTN family beta-propeller protein
MGRQQSRLPALQSEGKVIVYGSSRWGYTMGIFPCHGCARFNHAVARPPDVAILVYATLRPLKFETQDTLTHGLALTPDGKELWVSSLLDDCLYIYDVQLKKIVASVPTGEGPNWIVITPDGRYVCVSNTDTDDVTIIDAKSRREVARVKVTQVPKRLALAPAPLTSEAQKNSEHTIK